MFNLQKILAMITLGFAFSSSQAQEARQRFHNPAENLITGGQPTQSELLQLKDSGVTRIINLRSPNEEVAFGAKHRTTASLLTCPNSNAGWKVKPGRQPFKVGTLPQKPYHSN